MNQLYFNKIQILTLFKLEVQNFTSAIVGQYTAVIQIPLHDAYRAQCESPTLVSINPSGTQASGAWVINAMLIVSLLSFKNPHGSILLLLS